MIVAKHWILFGTLSVGLVSCVGLASCVSSKSDQSKTASCKIETTPVAELNYGSRYAKDSKNRSEISGTNNEDVNTALKPVDDLVQDMSRTANAALAETSKSKRTAKADCVFDAVYLWAQADALSNLNTVNAQLSSPSRLGGIAAAYRQILPLASKDEAAKRVVADWFSRRAEAMVVFFDEQAPKKATQNNLRAWAGFAAGEIGIVTGNSQLITWAYDGNRKMISSANVDGSLPLEMARGKFALHYQLHATSALVGSIASLCREGYRLDAGEFAGLKKIAQFSLEAISEPNRVATLAGEDQKIDPIKAKKTSAIAWVEPYQAITNESVMQFQSVRPLANSKLGGNMTQIYSGQSINCVEPISG